MVVLASEKRWLVTLYALNKIVAPDLKDVVKEGMDSLYVDLDDRLNGLATPCTLKTLTYGVVNPPRTTANYCLFLKDFKFGNINSNFDIHGDNKAAYDYKVNNSVDVAKLYLPYYLAVFSAFDKSMDVAAALRLLGCTKYPLHIFTSSIPFFDICSLADDVRVTVRNKGDHFKEVEWTETFFDECFDKLNTLVQCLPLTTARKDKLLDELSEWRTEGFKKIVDEDFKDLLKNFQNGKFEAINEKLDKIPTRDERNEMMKTMRDGFKKMQNLLCTALDQGRDHFRNGAYIETSVQGSSVSPTNATLTEGCGANDEGNGVTESCETEELKNPSAAVEELPENQEQLEPNESPQIRPNQVPLQFPKPPFSIILKENLKEDSGKAKFKNLGEVILRKIGDNEFYGQALPESSRGGLFKVAIESQNGEFLGETQILYVDLAENILEVLVKNKEEMKMFLRATFPCQDANSGRGSCDTLNSICTGPSGEQKTSLSVQLLLRLLYKAAEVNAKWFIHLIFNLPAGRTAFNSYKETSLLPEDVASSHGHEEIAQYLRNVKKRFSVNEEGREGRSRDIDWQEIMDAIEATQTETIQLSMATAQEYTKEQLNYFRVCYLTTDIIAEGLRAIFKQEWDGRYKTMLGEWKDEPQNGLDFKNSESPRKQREKNRLLATMVNGKRTEWDCTILFYAILFSDCIGNGLNPTIRSKVDDLRKFRNEDFARMPHGNLTDAEFQNAINKVDVAFQALGLSTDQIQEIQNQTSFPTEELKNVLKRVEDLKQEVEVLEAQLNKDISAFCVLPPKPTHEVADRNFEVAKIVKQLKDLKEANKNRLSYLYISGSPGSGKSQLAGLVSKRVFDQVGEIPDSISFAMTVNAESPKTLLESYVSFARKLKCPEYVISNTLNSPDLSSDEKIAHLKTLVGSKIGLYTTWLLVVDNVRSISNIHGYLPESGNEQWARGQLLITTQDITSVPSTSCFIYHVSVSKGMELQDARSLLEKLSGISDCETDKVAQVLDYQPLALAIAATYVREAQQNKENFGWKNYLQRLDKGQGVATASIFVETNPTYPKCMTEVSEIAVEKAMRSSNAVLKHTLTLLSLCAAQPLSLEVVVNYIRNVEVDMQDEDDIRMKILRCPLLLFDENDSGVYIRVHQVTHDAVSSVVGGNTKEREVKAILKSLFQFVKDYKLNDPNDLNSIVKGTRTVPHLRTLVRTIRQTYSKENVSEVAENDIFHTSSMLYLNELAKACYKYCAFAEAKEYFELSFRILVKTLGPEHVDVAETYNNLGTMHLNLGELSQAKEFYDCALAISLKKLGPEHVDVAQTYNNLGILHHNLGELSQAKQFHDRALAIRLKKLGPEHVNVADTYKNLGNVHYNLGELSQAKEFYDRALAIRLKKFGPKDVDVATIYQKLGSVHHNLGELSQAKEYHDRALAVRLEKPEPEVVTWRFSRGFKKRSNDSAHSRLVAEKRWKKN